MIEVAVVVVLLATTSTPPLKTSAAAAADLRLSALASKEDDHWSTAAATTGAGKHDAIEEVVVLGRSSKITGSHFESTRREQLYQARRNTAEGAHVRRLMVASCSGRWRYLAKKSQRSLFQLCAILRVASIWERSIFFGGVFPYEDLFEVLFPRDGLSEEEEKEVSGSLSPA